MSRFQVIVLLAVAAAATAWDFAALGYADVYDERTDVHMWLPPGYTLTNPDGAQVQASWDEGELKGLGVMVQWKSALGGVTPSVLEKAMDENDRVTNLVPEDERVLPPKRLAAFCADAAEGRTVRFEIDSREGVPLGGLCYFVLAHGKTYIFSIKWPLGNKAAEEAADRIAAGYCIGLRPAVRVNPETVVAP